jgi:hypothetical protein
MGGTWPVAGLIMLLAGPVLAQADGGQAAGPIWTSRGQPRSAETTELAVPLVEDGRRLTRVQTVKQWDCPGRMQRVIRKLYYGADGRFIRSDRAPEPWTPADEKGAEFAAACGPAVPSS